MTPRPYVTAGGTSTWQPPGTPDEIALRRRLTKARQVLQDPTHPQHALVARVLDDAIELDGGEAT